MGQLSVESRKRVCLKGCSVKEIRQGLKDENIVTSHHASALASMQSSTNVGLAYFPERDGTIPENTAKLIYGTGRLFELFPVINHT